MSKYYTSEHKNRGVIGSRPSSVVKIFFLLFFSRCLGVKRVIDVGVGHGHVLFIAKYCFLLEVGGVELIPPSQPIIDYKRCDVHVLDATNVDLDSLFELKRSDLIWIYNPFEDALFDRFIEINKDKLSEVQPRIYYNNPTGLKKIRNLVWGISIRNGFWGYFL
jgi:SAM-dependent methyltransferase